MAAVAIQAGRSEVGVELLSRALAQQPAWEEAWGNFAIALHSVGRINDAGLAARRAIQLNPSRPDHHFNLGMALFAQGQFADAAKSFDQATKLRTSYPEAHANLGVTLAELGQTDDAVASLRRAAMMAPDRAAFWSNLGTVLSDSGDLAGAIMACRRAISLQADNPDAWNGLGMAIARTGKFAEAQVAFEHAISLRPSDVAAHWNRSLILLVEGKFAEGWPEFEWRLKKQTPQSSRRFPAPLWDGSPLNGRTIFLLQEQGFGDFLQMVRYVPLLAEQGAKVILGCLPELRELARFVKGVQQLVVPGEELPAFDVYCSLMSLPAILKTDLTTIPSSVPYLFPDEQKCARWSQRMSRDRSGRKVGLVWTGRRTHTNDRRRSLPVASLAPLAGVRDVTFYSLQQDQSPPQLPGLNLIDRTAELKSFSDAAAMIANLDLVISADTALAHLAGALGKPTWLMLPFSPDWRWLLKREDSPWYPTMRLFRQPQLDDWEPVIGRIAGELNR